MKAVFQRGGGGEIDLTFEEFPVQFRGFTLEIGYVHLRSQFSEGVKQRDAVGVGDLSDSDHETSGKPPYHRRFWLGLSSVPFSPNPAIEMFGPFC